MTPAQTTHLPDKPAPGTPPGPLAVLADDADATHLCDALLRAGFTDVVHQGPAVAADLALVHTVCGLSSDRLLPWLQQRTPAQRGPVSWIAAAPDAAALPALLHAGLTGWWPQAVLAPQLLQVALAQDQQRWQREQRLAADLAQQRALLDERRWVERAKGVLMQPRSGGVGLAEDEAFALLRSAAMHSKLRLADLSRALVETLQWAEAINRAGQLRMLSQRLVKLAAQQLARIDLEAAKAQGQAAAQRLQDNLLHLSRLPLVVLPQGAPALVAAQSAWASLQAALARRLTRASLAQADQQAEALLAAAEALTELLQTSGARPALQVVNLCGRQRMASQRLAKQALLGVLLDEPARLASLAPLVQALNEGVAELGASPLSSPEIRQALAGVAEHWQRMRLGLREATGDDGLAMLARASDQLLDSLEQLTADYERSLQVLMA